MHQVAKHKSFYGCQQKSLLVLVLLNRVTVGICAYNEGNNIGRLLHSVFHEQEVSADSEILVVCSGYMDNTTGIVQSHASLDSRVKPHFEKARKGKASAINYILANAKREIIVFVSAGTCQPRGCSQS